MTIQPKTDSTESARPRQSLWSQARGLAERTPASRNRYVDFLRGASISAVVLGHWLMAAPYYEPGKPDMQHLLAVAPWSQWITWIFQVMPIFFFVGGYANLTSWRACVRRGETYADWLGGRMQRLLQPVLPLIAVWAVLALLGWGFGVPEGFVRVGSRIALVPTWFLAVYLLVVLFVPLSSMAWDRCGLWSAAALAACAGLVDLAFFAAGRQHLGWFNYLFVWLAIHQLGYAWRDGKFDSAGKTFCLFPAGLSTLIFLVAYGPYPLSLVGVPTETVSNTLPPKLPLLALGTAQIGLLLSMQNPARRWLDRTTPWAATVMVNGMIMTLFLWHSTAMMLVIGAGYLLRPEVYSAVPGTLAWWLWRPAWVGAFAAATAPFLLVFSRFERNAEVRRRPAATVRRLYAGCVLSCAGLAWLALKGIGGSPHWLVDAAGLALPFSGAVVAGVIPKAGRTGTARTPRA